MSKIFSTNVFIKGFMAFYEVSTSSIGIYHLNLKICRLQKDPPPKFLRIQFIDNTWHCLDEVQSEFTFIADVIGKRIQKITLPDAGNDLSYFNKVDCHN